MKMSTLAERQVLKAQAEGQFDNLEGTGKPLPDRGGGDFAQAVGFRMMADAGVVPREIELKKAVIGQKAILQRTIDPDAQKLEMAKLAKLELRLAIEQEARKLLFSDL